MMRKLLPFAAAVAAGFAVAGLNQLASPPTGFIYALIGFVGGVLICLGIPFAFGVFPLQNRHQMHPDEAAVVAEQRGCGITLAYNESAALTHRLEQDAVGALRPLVVTTGRAVSVSPSSEEATAKLVKVGHLAAHLTHEDVVTSGHA